MAIRTSAVLIRAGTFVLALAPPILLYRVGWISPGVVSADQLRGWLSQPLSAGFLALLGQVGAWLLWLLLAVAIAEHTRQSLADRLRWHVVLHLPRPLQTLTAVLLGSTAATTVAALPAAADNTVAMDAEPSPNAPSSAAEERLTLDALNAPPAPTSRVPRGETLGTPPALTVPVRSAPPPTLRQEAAANVAPSTPRDTCRVVAADTLWDLAAKHLGDPERWREIYTLNRGHKQANGYALTDPDEIHVGWTLALPARATTPAPGIPDPTAPNPGSPDVAAPGTTDTAPTAPPPAPPASAIPAPHNKTASTPRPPTPAPATPSVPADGAAPASESLPDQPSDEAGVALPTQGWISLGLAAAIAAVAALLRLHRHRHARLIFPASVSTGAQSTLAPPWLIDVETIGSRDLSAAVGDHRRASPAVPAPVGVDRDGNEVSLFHLPGPGLALKGDAAIPAARAVLAAALTTGVTDSATARPVVVTTADLLARLLPPGAPLVGLDPDGTAYDGERLVLLADIAAAVTHAEEEMIGRRRLLDTFHAETISDLNARTDHAETQPPYVLLIESSPRHAARLQAVATHRAALDLHPVILGPHNGIPTVEITAEGTTTGDEPHSVTRLSTLGADDLAAILSMLTDAIARPEAGADVDDPPAEISPAAAIVETTEGVPVQPGDAAALVRLRVLGPVTVATDAGPIATGMRSGSYTALTVLAAHPAGRTLDQLAADLHPDIDPTAAVKRVRTDITSARRVLRAATGHEEPMFIVYAPATTRYQLDPETVTVDLWQMLTAIDQATTTDDEATILAALRRAAELYRGDFAESHNHLWATDYAASYRHQILTAYARIAEILEPDHPNQAIAALERATDLDPVNEELYQRIMRIHGRQLRPDAVRRTLRRLEERLADLGDAEPSQATRRVAERQLQPVAPASGGRP
ncbi:BTAD domain-containing putative transcriptional regulator [Micromonospora sp. WMMD1120]|uniref:BTAD domain-containing putative transcriptional regulator n=1 Tax=Micromonospora sp. WMMD1120 TaxID=3016106 RepID=UPI002415DF48|nr:BTAD domain-containing putative transcriptional regulator [Micromonospora sp. WMMD1120]MDG4807627.1 BTAD domain-containing putative transcriptional regulator [Micromonospora sp. WMMD1120]